MARFNFSFFDSGARFDTPDANPSSSMRNLAHFLDNPFDDKEISEAELAAFTTDHLERFIANNTNNDFSLWESPNGNNNWGWTDLLISKGNYKIVSSASKPNDYKLMPDE